MNDHNSINHRTPKVYKYFIEIPTIPADEIIRSLKGDSEIIDKEGRTWNFVIFPATNYNIYVFAKGDLPIIEKNVGYAKISIEKNKNGEIFVYMLDFEINLHYRNKGIGKKLDKFVAKIGILNGATKIFGLKSNDSPITPFFYDSQRYKSITIDGNLSVIRDIDPENE